jgi:hypothetical protein
MNIAFLIFTDGRLEYLARALDSAEKNLQCHFAVRRIVNDEPLVEDVLRKTYEPRGYEVVSHAERLGFCGSIQAAWNDLPAGAEWVWHCEDDFTYNEPIPVMQMIKVMQFHGYLALLRQAVNNEEQAAGGIIQLHPNWFTEKKWREFCWLEYNVCMTSNPSLYPASITKYPYGEKGDGEGKIGKLLRDEGYLYAYWGGLDQGPKVTHIGEHRSEGAFY